MSSMTQNEEKTVEEKSETVVPVPKVETPTPEPTEQPVSHEKVIQVNRCAKVVKGGRRFHFSALVVVGNGAGELALPMA